MTLTLPIATAPLRGTLGVPGDKSLAHRAMLFAALAEGVSTIRDYPDSGVTRAMRGALAALGVPSDLEDGTLRVTGNGFRPFPNAGAQAFAVIPPPRSGSWPVRWRARVPPASWMVRKDSGGVRWAA